MGKSSLLKSAGARKKRAVVNDLAGTTRDPVDEIVNIDGEDWLFIDTAGIKRRQHKLTARNIIPLCARRPPSSAVNWR